MPAKDEDDQPWNRKGRNDRDDDDDRPRRRPRDEDGYDDDRPRKRPRDGDDDFEDDRPRKRRRFEDSDDRSAPAQSNGLATAGLILGILAFFTLGLTSLPGFICSAIALGKPAKRGAAVAGLVLSLFGGLVGGALLVALLLPATYKVREAAARLKDQNNLKQLALSGHNFHSANAKLPQADGQLSWRVHMLPYLEQDQLFKQFNLNQPWDSATNKPLASRPIQTFMSPSEPTPGPDTRYRVFVGPDTMFRPGKKSMTLVDVTDGTSNTFYIVEAGDTVPWPQPKELTYSRTAPVPALGHPHRNGFNVAFMDGSVRFIKKGASESALRAGIEPTDGKPFIE
ncbi:MAG TPA: DUF1559 domain-containing protein [Gemmata sp.]